MSEASYKNYYLPAYYSISNINLLSYLSLECSFSAFLHNQKRISLCFCWFQLGNRGVFYGQRDLLIWRDESKGFWGIWVILNLKEVRKKRVESSTKGWSVNKKYFSLCSGHQSGLSGIRKDASPYSKSPWPVVQKN